MNITITGATGFVGRRLVERLSRERHSLHILSRAATQSSAGIARTFVWDPFKGPPPEESLSGADAVIHLAGEPVSQRWTPEAKHRIRESRVRGTRGLVEAMSRSGKRPSVLVSASAIGYYGSRGDEILTEMSAPGQGFLPQVCAEWEQEAVAAEAFGVRVVRLRTGIALGRGGGALAKMLPPFKLGVGGQIGSGRRWMSWIHLDDLVGLILHAVQSPIHGALNCTAPNPVTNAEFTRALAGNLKRPAIFPVPPLALKILFGEMAEIVLASLRVTPRAAQDSGYRFRYTELPSALGDILA